MRCDVCGLPDPYRGQGDGIGSCDCPRCDCGTARSSALCTCPPDDDGMCSCESYDCQGECCGPGQCSCTPANDDDMEAHAAAYNLRYEERRRLYYERYWARVDRRTWRRVTARELTPPLLADGLSYRRRCLARRRRR